MATNAEIWAAQRAAVAARDARKNLPSRLTDRACFANGADAALMCEASSALQWYEDEIKRMRKEANDEAKEAQRDARAAYSDGRHDGMDEARGGF